MQLHKDVSEMLDECIRIRHELHRIPEIGFELHETHDYIVKELEKCAPDELITIADTGVKAVFYAENAEETLAFRADMDGLNTKEENQTDYCSLHPGKMHGCGHDGHMTMVLMLAQLISRRRSMLKYNIVLIFQPGEEGWSGAKRMIAEGALKSPAVDRIYGMHVWPTVPKGKIGLRWGPMMAQTSEFSLTINGKSTHAASPQMGIDAVVVAAELITLLQTIITRNVDPHQDALLTIGKITGGTARNIIAEKVTLEGTFRMFSKELYEKLVERIVSVIRGIETATGAKIEYNELIHYPSIDNPRELVENLYSCLDGMEDTYLQEPVMAAEDFADYQQAVPGLYMFLGIAGGKNKHSLHNSRFDFDEEVLLIGVETFGRIAGIL